MKLSPDIPPVLSSHRKEKAACQLHISNTHLFFPSSRLPASPLFIVYLRKMSILYRLNWKVVENPVNEICGVLAQKSRARGTWAVARWLCTSSSHQAFAQSQKLVRCARERDSSGHILPTPTLPLKGFPGVS